MVGCTGGFLYLQAQYMETQSQWGQAADNYVQLITQTRAPELHLDVADHLSFLFEEINQDELRRPILD